jgi:hypothetical protein
MLSRDRVFHCSCKQTLYLRREARITSTASRQRSHAASASTAAASFGPASTATSCRNRFDEAPFRPKTFHTKFYRHIFVETKERTRPPPQIWKRLLVSHASKRTRVQLYKSNFTSPILQVQFYKVNFTSPISQVEFYKYNFTSTILQVKLYKSNFTSTILQVKLYKSNFSSQTLQVKLYKSNFTSPILQVQFYMLCSLNP